MTTTAPAQPFTVRTFLLGPDCPDTADALAGPLHDGGTADGLLRGTRPCPRGRPGRRTRTGGRRRLLPLPGRLRRGGRRVAQTRRSHRGRAPHPGHPGQPGGGRAGEPRDHVRPPPLHRRLPGRRQSRHPRRPARPSLPDQRARHRRTRRPRGRHTQRAVCWRPVSPSSRFCWRSVRADWTSPASGTCTPRSPCCGTSPRRHRHHHLRRRSRRRPYSRPRSSTGPGTSTAPLRGPESTAAAWEICSACAPASEAESGPAPAHRSHRGGPGGLWSAFGCGLSDHPDGVQNTQHGQNRADEAKRHGVAAFEPLPGPAADLGREGGTEDGHGRTAHSQEQTHDGVHHASSGLGGEVRLSRTSPYRVALPAPTAPSGEQRADNDHGHQEHAYGQVRRPGGPSGPLIRQSDPFVHSGSLPD